jgi:DNA-binding NarL/FixJ family response regulator
MIAISIVEDIKDVRESLQRLIESAQGFLCLSIYSNAEDALKGLPLVNPDIVLMDINLPGMNGIECIKKIKTVCPKIQFMMFTIFEDREQVFEALAAGASGYLLKKTPKEKILEALHELHEGGSPMSSHIARKVVDYFQKEKEARDTAAQLSQREKEVLELLSKGFLYKEIGDKLNITPGTVAQHIHKIYDKLHVENRTEAVNKFFGRS